MYSDENFAFKRDVFTGANLDYALERGYYRMQAVMFTTNRAHVGKDFSPVSVFWLRTNLAKTTPTKTSKQISKRCAKFDVQITDAHINPEIENLFQQYRHNVHFNTADTCSDYLEFPFISNPFDSKLIEIRYRQQLIAVGYFDVGKKAIAGIMNFYHPDFKQYSLGKFLMLQKMQYAAQQNMQWYYTGYISTHTPKFDYKIFPNKEALEVYLPNEAIWAPYTIWNKEKLSGYTTNHIDFFDVL